MFDELTKYKKKNHFFFTGEDNFEKECNAPKNKSGVYIVYALKNGRIELVYIGSSGKVQNNGKIKHCDGGLFSSIVKDYSEGSWKQNLIDENIEALDIYWYETINSGIRDIPAYVEAIILQRFFEIHGRLPAWNEEF